MGTTYHSLDYIKGEFIMKLNAPKTITWIIAVVLGLLGLVGHLELIAALTPYAFWLAFIGFALLALGSYFSGL